MSDVTVYIVSERLADRSTEKKPLKKASPTAVIKSAQAQQPKARS